MANTDFKSRSFLSQHALRISILLLLLLFNITIYPVPTLLTSFSAPQVSSNTIPPRPPPAQEISAHDLQISLSHRLSAHQSVMNQDDMALGTSLSHISVLLSSTTMLINYETQRFNNPDHVTRDTVRRLRKLLQGLDNGMEGFAEQLLQEVRSLEGVLNEMEGEVRNMRAFVEDMERLVGA